MFKMYSSSDKLSSLYILALRTVLYSVNVCKIKAIYLILEHKDNGRKLMHSVHEQQRL